MPTQRWYTDTSNADPFPGLFNSTGSWKQCGYYLLERIVSEMAGFLYLQLLRAQALTTLALG